MLGNSTLTIVNHVNELHLQTQVKGDLDASAYTVLTSMVAAESTAKVLTFSRDAGWAARCCVLGRAHSLRL